MSKLVINLEEPKREINYPQNPPATVKKRRGCLKIFGVLAILLFFLLSIAALGGYFYWQSVKQTPQYSLAVLLDAARRDDKEKVAEIIDAEEVVNNFIPQITDQAAELYGRNLPPQVLSKVAQIVTPLLPAIKAKAKDELPQLIREKTEKFSNVPYWIIALFAERGLEIKVVGDTAQVKSRIPDKPLEIKMKREGGIWTITEVKDETTARKIAEKIGQQLLALAGKGNLRNAEDELKIDNLGELLKNLNDIFK